VIALLLALLLGVLKVRYGGGRDYPNVSTAALLGPGELQVLVELDLPPGNITTSEDGRVFFNTHPFTQSHRITDAFLFELVDGKPRPYPDVQSQPDSKFVFGMTVDRQRRLWLTSPATLDRSTTRIQAYDLNTNKRVVDHELPPGVGRFAQDLRVSADGKTLFLADTGAFRFTHASLLIVSLSDWTVREVLGGDPATQPQDWVIRAANGPHRIGYGLITFQVGIDGIALSKDGATLYFGTMSHDTLYRISTASLLDLTLTPAELSLRLEKVGKKPLSDGIEVAPDGSILITDIENGGIARLAQDGKLTTLVRDAKISWADGVAVTPTGDVLFTDSSIPTYFDQLLRPPSIERMRANKPYHIYRFRLPAPMP
jgi:sugar lactone lactonase YvrE